MQPTSLAFKQNAHRALADPALQQALGFARAGFQQKRADAAARLPEFEALRDAAKAIKDHTLAHLDLYLEAFERRVVEQGGKVHWARDDAEARRVVLRLCREAGARSVTKSKSMIAEEIGLNEALEAAGIARVETDLGEYIVQLAGQTPSHILAPAIHMTKSQVSQLFAKHHGTPPLDEPEALLGEARRVLRQRYFEADVGITGANFLVAETGSIVLVTNEGNAELTQGLPKTHIAIASIDKLVPTLDDACTLLRVLARSATGQEFSAYTTFLTGPKRAADLDGPENLHVVLLDNGRSAMLGTELQDMLRCIRCGACMNHCPVYLATGGHAYGWVYPGPMGAVLTPSFIGIEQGRHLPSASTFCGRCEQVCPMRIPLPRMMRYWREQHFAGPSSPPVQRYATRLWAFAATRPWLYGPASRAGDRDARSARAPHRALSPSAARGRLDRLARPAGTRGPDFSGAMARRASVPAMTDDCPRRDPRPPAQGARPLRRRQRGGRCQARGHHPGARRPRSSRPDRAVRPPGRSRADHRPTPARRFRGPRGRGRLFARQEPADAPGDGARPGARPAGLAGDARDPPRRAPWMPIPWASPPLLPASPRPAP